jgi:hypothetical protein
VVDGVGGAVGTAGVEQNRFHPYTLSFRRGSLSRGGYKWS